jgi:DNA gyrase/topoisomerase IV subunit A
VIESDLDLLTIISAEGTVMRTEAGDISCYNRSARGVLIMQMREGDQVASMARFTDADLNQDSEEQD